MKYFLIAVFIFIGIYLNRSYAYFYDFQGSHFISNPNYPATHLFQTSKNAEVKTLAVLGDSLMSGTGSTKEENSMAYLIASNLSRDQNIELHNFAKPGVGIKDVLDGQIEEAMTIKPDYIVLMIGTNDVHNKMPLAEFNNGFATAITKLITHTDAKIIVINIPYIGSDKILLKPWNSLLEARIEEFNKAIFAHVSGKQRVEIIDLYSQSAGEFKKSSDLYSSDQFHPSDKGYARWAEYINSHLNR